MRAPCEVSPLVRSDGWRRPLHAVRGDQVTERDRGYGWPHEQDRRRWARRVASGMVLCRRCGNPILIVNGVPEPWDLGHNDTNRSLPAMPEHQRCNRRTSAHRVERRSGRSSRPLPVPRPSPEDFAELGRRIEEGRGVVRCSNCGRAIVPPEAWRQDSALGPVHDRPCPAEYSADELPRPRIWSRDWFGP